MSYLKKRVFSFKCAFKGIATAFKEEAHMKIHVLALILVALAGWLFSISSMEWIACFFCFGIVISAELFNSAIEAIVDKVSPEHHPLAGKAKDIGAGAVLVVSMVSAVVGGIIFFPKVWNLL